VADKRLVAALMESLAAGVVHGEQMKTSTEMREEETVAVSGVGVADLWLG
jgi:hypothetical protein